jgi:Uncharacterized protein conserved in bacteria
MISWARFTLIAGTLASLAACESKKDKDRALLTGLQRRENRLESRLAQADKRSDDVPVAKWIMPENLKEISGIAVTADGRLLAHDDELSRIFEIDPRRGVIVKSFLFGNGLRGDFEGITIAGQNIWVIKSNGKLYTFHEGENGTRVPYTSFDTKLGKECEFEGIAYQADSSWLVLPCKNARGKGLDDEFVIYRWRIGSDASTGITKLEIPLSEVVGNNKWKRFRASDITIDPETGDYVIISSLEHGLIVMRPDGEIIDSRSLPGKHHQAEGVAITKDSVLIISDEASSKPPAITLYRWRRLEKGDDNK